MLNHFETWLADRLRAALPESTKLVAGPMLPPAAADTPLLNLSAIKLRSLRQAPGNAEDLRDAVQLTQTVTLNGNGLRLDFPLETGTVKRILEIETAPGRLARRGDDYEFHVHQISEGGKVTETEGLTFYRPPAGDFNLFLKLDTRARGYQQRSPCRATIEISAWAAQISQADEQLTQAVGAILASLSGIDRLDLARCEQPGFSLRLLNPRGDLRVVERVRIADGEQLCRSKTTLSLHGELELKLVLGEALAENTIDRIIYQVTPLETGE
jgi:hypothetical protein